VVIWCPLPVTTFLAAFACRQDKARQKLHQSGGLFGKSKGNAASGVIVTDEYYAACISLRSVPVSDFLGPSPPVWPLPITSINEDRLLKELGLSNAERSAIEGLQFAQASTPDPSGSGMGLTEEQLSSRAIVRIAATAPPEVGAMQRRTAKWLLRTPCEIEPNTAW
jgi:hypothetical protein